MFGFFVLEIPKTGRISVLDNSKSTPKWFVEKKFFIFHVRSFDPFVMNFGILKVHRICNFEKKGISKILIFFMSLDTFLVGGTRRTAKLVKIHLFR